jgi:hypothetical protein
MPVYKNRPPMDADAELPSRPAGGRHQKRDDLLLFVEDQIAFQYRPADGGDLGLGREGLAVP